jgi:hypothetical protein
MIYDTICNMWYVGNTFLPKYSKLSSAKIRIVALFVIIDILT